MILRFLCLVLFLSTTGCSSTAANEAYVSVGENARSGGMRITAIDGEPVTATDGIFLPTGVRKVSVACRLDNGLSLTFDFEVELEASNSYCLFSKNQGKSCTIVYNKFDWTEKEFIGCK